MNDKLLPCPFCGSGAVMINTSTIYWETYSVMCDGAIDGDCAGLNGSSQCDTEQDAVTAWNKRANHER